MRFQKIQLLKHQDYIRLQSLALRQHSRQIAVRAIYSFVTTRQQRVVMIVWARWRTFAAERFQEDVKNANEYLKEREDDLANEQAVLDQKSHQVQVRPGWVWRPLLWSRSRAGTASKMPRDGCTK